MMIQIVENEPARRRALEPMSINLVAQKVVPFFKKREATKATTTEIIKTVRIK